MLRGTTVPRRFSIGAMMPIRKTKGGWKWGSKGPFKSRKKAAAVARAAYAHGYKGSGKRRKKK